MIKLQYLCTVNEGSAYTIGLEKGKNMAKIYPELREYMLYPENIGGELSDKEVERRLSLLEHFCPGIQDELTGFAAGLDLPITNLYQLRTCFRSNPCACSLFAVPAGFSDNGHALLARSYEYNTDDELIFNVTRENGKYKHLGFSLFQVGRFDGMNEKGLCVAIASCENVRQSSGIEGIGFSVVVRRLLDSCSTVEEAIKLMLEMPIAENTNYALIDACGDAAIVEVLIDKGTSIKTVRRNDGPVYAFNHYISEKSRNLAPERKLFSLTRQLKAEKICTENPKLSIKELKKLLTDNFPEGLCCHDYSNWFGTLHSMLFDAVEKRAWVCLGPSDTGLWFEADLNAPVGYELKEIAIEDRTIDTKYWEKA